jgi:hypothetical protein
VLSTSATGSLTSAKTTASKLTFNASTGNLSATQLTGTLQTAAQTNITSVGTLTGLTVAGNFTNYAASAGATIVTFGNARTNDYVWMDYNSNPGASDGYTIGGRRTYSSLTGSKVQVATEQFAKEGTGTDNKTYWQMSLHNGTSIASVLTMSSAGNLTVPAGSVTSANGFVESSSITLKENVAPITNGLDIILQLLGVTYDRKDGSRINEAGLIAEDVAKVAGNLVSRDEHGNPVGIYYSKLTAYLVEAVKKLNDEINSLKGL